MRFGLAGGGGCFHCCAALFAIDELGIIRQDR
jgi:hypothetical protein